MVCINSDKKRITYLRLGLLFLVALACMVAFVLVQPFGDGPDEIDRYKVVQFIVNHGTLPVGNDPEVLLENYGGSYAYQPILTYMIQGYLIRALSFCGLSAATELIIARFVCVLCGMVAAAYTYLIGREIFTNEKTVYLFTIAVVFLPQNLFIHTYVNTDSMGLMSVAMIIYAILRGKRTDYDIASIVNMSVGIIFCALSYYNCYGIVLVAIVAFIWTRPSKFWKKAGTIALIAFLGAGWWFIRNGILYNGDIFALNAREICMTLTADAEHNPLTRATYLSQGIPVFEMIFKTDYYTLCWKSFIAMFGPMRIPTAHFIYEIYKYLCILSIFGVFVVWVKSSSFASYTKRDRIIINCLLVLSIIIPASLAVYYSYTWEFQPQGRYYLPMLIPFMYVLSVGLEKIIALASNVAAKINAKAGMILSSLLYHTVYAYIGAAAVFSVFYMMLKYYGVY